MSDNFNDQSQFSQESSFYQPIDEVAKPVVPEFEAAPPTLTSQKKILLISGVVLGVILIVMAISLILNKKTLDDTSFQPSPTNSAATLSDSPLNARVTELEQELKIADPAQEDLPFPPVDFEISVDN